MTARKKYVKSSAAIGLRQITRTHHISDVKKSELENLFLMDGITPRAASDLVGVGYVTACRYFEQWSNELLNDPSHETYVYRQKRVRARALEGITKKIIDVTHQKSILEKISLKLTHTKGIINNVNTLQHNLILSYSSKIAELTNQLITLQNEYDGIDSAPPADILLKAEMLALYNETILD